MILVDFHAEATRYADLDAAASAVFVGRETLEKCASIEITRGTDGGGGWFVKALDDRGAVLGLLNGRL